MELVTSTFLIDRVLFSNTVDSLSTTITSSCGAGSVTWESPHGSQAITFLRNTSFTLCLSSNSASSHAAVYRLIGPSRRLLVPKSHDGMLGCYDSQCSHVSLLIESQNSSGHVELMYQISMANSKSQICIFTMRHVRTAISVRTGCPSCTESCQITCLCTAPYGKPPSQVWLPLRLKIPQRGGFQCCFVFVRIIAFAFSVHRRGSSVYFGGRTIHSFHADY